MPRLFIDLDGVLADFDAGHEIAFGHRPSKEQDRVNWEIVRAHEGVYGSFYAGLPPMEDWRVLWEGVAHLSPTILTGVPPEIPDAPLHKRAWVDRIIGPDARMITCRSVEKSLHAEPGDVLVDDWEKHRHVWEKMGGVWITHTSAARSLELIHEIFGKV
jgi:hypothetical protein